MPLEVLNAHLPMGTLPQIQQWAKGYPLRIKITRERKTKLGDYRKAPNGLHHITVNGNLQPELFFFVLTHELAHLLAFEKYSRQIAPHGAEWKITFGRMILESLELYPLELQRLLIPFSRAPRANFMASPTLVKYFDVSNPSDPKTYVENLQTKDQFQFKGETYLMMEKLKKNYLCKQIGTGRIYRFSALAKVEKLERNG